MLMGVRTSLHSKCDVLEMFCGFVISFGFEKGFMFKLCIVYGLLLMVLFICTYSFLLSVPLVHIR